MRSVSGEQFRRFGDLVDLLQSGLPLEPFLRILGHETAIADLECELRKRYFNGMQTKSSTSKPNRNGSRSELLPGDAVFQLYAEVVLPSEFAKREGVHHIVLALVEARLASPEIFLARDVIARRVGLELNTVTTLAFAVKNAIQPPYFLEKAPSRGWRLGKR